MGGRMSGLGLNMRVKIDRQRLLSSLRENKEKHTRLFQEARRGFIEKAQAEISRKLEDLRSERFNSLHFNLNPPEFHGDAYDTAIQMYEWSSEDSVELSASEFRMLVQDQWDWKHQWLLSNAGYSTSINDMVINSEQF